MLEYFDLGELSRTSTRAIFIWRFLFVRSVDENQVRNVCQLFLGKKGCNGSAGLYDQRGLATWGRWRGFNVN